MKVLIWKYGVVGTLQARKLIIFDIVQLLLPQRTSNGIKYFWTKADKYWAKEFQTIKESK